MSTRSFGRCLVCDANAIGINFAVPTCAPCKAFFRRNAVKLGVSCLLIKHITFVLYVNILETRFYLSTRWRLSSDN